MFREGLRRVYSVGRTAVYNTRANCRQSSLSAPQFESSGGSSNSHQFYRFVPPAALLNFSLLRLFNKDDGETAEEKLIMTIKRAILSIQRDEYEQAERILHMALRMAQDIQSKDGITYVYDSLANLAMERGDFVKAEKLFVDVMQRLFGDGADEGDIRLLHISAKVAHMAEQSGNLEKAQQGFEWTLKKLEEKLKEAEDDLQLRELWGMTKNWYAQSLMQSNMMKEAKAAFEDARQTYLEVHGKLSEEGLMLLNNLGVVCTHLGEFDAAEKYLNEAVELAKEVPEFLESAIFKANLGIVYLKKGMVQKATELCTLTWRLGQKNNHGAIMDQSSYCLDKIKEYQKNGGGKG